MDEGQAAPLPLSAPAGSLPDAPGSLEPAPALVPRRGRHLPRWLALLQILAVCGVPTQLVVALVLAAASGQSLVDATAIPFQFFATVSLIDAALVAILIRLFLSLSAERSTEVFLGARPVWGEVWRGLALLPIVMIAVTGIVLLVRAVAPWTHTVEHSPFEQFMDNPLEAAIFVVVVVLAGGVREELQRAFILHRFEQRLGGVRLGLVVFSIAFGALHAREQGVDVAIAVGLLGFFWGLMYVKRRSAILAMTNHASFDALQVVAGVLRH